MKPSRYELVVAEFLDCVAGRRINGERHDAVAKGLGVMKLFRNCFRTYLQDNKEIRCIRKEGAAKIEGVQ
ncbi:hypothetical protein FP2506_09121 [Fulvimarina pelagi HTCC2506]|uniref:Uncharacterized protein n=1 Tax=Fulvimarina pelagi HTCC2506 TaxID=314231 RepID=Q0G5S2_9HYPH|nr:hypothetical protein FP2506_09121 [Fulvimarina pelagi HTCC2506]